MARRPASLRTVRRPRGPPVLTALTDDGIVVRRAVARIYGEVHQLAVDFSERGAKLVDLERQCGSFDVQMVRLPTGDYLIDKAVLVERKTYADLATSLADGRLFPQAAVLAQSPHVQLCCSKDRACARTCPTFIQTP